MNTLHNFERLWIEIFPSPEDVYFVCPNRPNVIERES